MPRQYEAIRDKSIAAGMSEKDAKTKAAKIYNSKHPDNPVTGKHDETKKRMRGVRNFNGK